MAYKLPLDFYRQSDVLAISRGLLGKLLVTQLPTLENSIAPLTAGIIIETEAYCGVEDKASHAYNNRRTKRTETMFNAGGVSYVYLCYGIHSLFNVITGPKDLPHAVLIRAIKPIDGIEHMLTRRQQTILQPNLASGPGTLTQALGINTTHNNLDLTEQKIWIEDIGLNIPLEKIIATPRIGINYAQEYVSMPWRFLIKDNALP